MKQAESKNDPHVKALHYWVLHGTGISYDGADPRTQDDDCKSVEVSDGRLTVSPKIHYATEEEAKKAFEPFIRNWEFDAAVEYGSAAFSLKYLGADIVDRNPAPTSAGDAQLSTRGYIGAVTGTAQATLLMGSYPTPPSAPLLDVDAAYVQRMLSQLDRYLETQKNLALYAYHCWEELHERSKPNQTSEHFAISSKVLGKVAKLCNTKGGEFHARHASGLDKGITQRT